MIRSFESREIRDLPAGARQLSNSHIRTMDAVSRIVHKGVCSSSPAIHPLLCNCRMAVLAKFDPALIANLFRLADEDRDGAISGGEAVKFFLRSGLSQECLGQVSLL